MAENRVRFPLRMSQDTDRLIKELMPIANCQSENEFIETAIRFYTGYLNTENVSDYLSRALVQTLQGIVDDNERRLRSLIFKWAVELEMLVNVIAAHYGDDNISLRELRGYAVEQVKRSNGQVDFERALDVQRQLPDDETWLD